MIAELISSSRYLVNGVKKNSVFNILNNFHIANGVPPCLTHDFLEGILQYDIPIILKRLIIDLKWLSESRLRYLYKTLVFDSLNEKRSAECFLKNYKLFGHAMQNRFFLMYLPFILHDFVKDVEEPCWKLILALSNILNLSMSPRLSINQTIFIEDVVRDYLILLKETFPCHSLKPKHHFILHYGQLLRELGPLVRLWTLWKQT